jgi:hypothetical protein
VSWVTRPVNWSPGLTQGRDVDEILPEEPEHETEGEHEDLRIQLEPLAARRA